MIIPLYLHTYTRTCISGCAVFAVVIFFIAVAGVVVTVISVTYFVFLFFFYKSNRQREKLDSFSASQ